MSDSLYLWWVNVYADILVLLSLLFSRGVISPVQAMSLATQRIANGRYEERVQVNGEDELAQLAARFNQMAEKLDQMESMRRCLIGDVSHELRNAAHSYQRLNGRFDG